MTDGRSLLERVTAPRYRPTVLFADGRD